MCTYETCVCIQKKAATQKRDVCGSCFCCYYYCCLPGFSGGKIKEGATRVELVTSRSAVECSATELYPQIRSYRLLHNYIHDNVLFAARPHVVMNGHSTRFSEFMTHVTATTTSAR